MNRTLLVYLRSLLVAGLFLLPSANALANHVVGMDLSYSWVSGMTYRVRLTVYGDCGTPTPDLSTSVPRICVYNGATSVGTFTLALTAPTTGTEITPVCPASIGATTCSGGTIPGIKKYVYTNTFTLPTTSQYWRFVFNGSMGSSNAGRASSIDNTTGVTVMQLIDSLDNRFVNNATATFTNDPTPYFCINNPNVYTPGGVDADGDSLVYTLVSARIGDGGGTCPGSLTSSNVTYTGNAWPGQPITGATPLKVNTGFFNVSQFNGQISFTPNVTQRSLVVYNVREYRAGVLVGSSQREMTFLVQTCATTPPDAGISSPVNAVTVTPTSLQVCHETGPFSFHLLPTSTDPSLNIKISATGIPAGATFNVINDSTANPDATFSWTSTGVTPGLYTINVTFRDDQCPINGSNTVPFSITINALADITGTPTVCVAATTTLADITPGGTWSTSIPAIATVNSTTGVVTGVSAGTAYITYTVGSCFKTMMVTVNAQPTPISGVLGLCVGATSTLASGGGPGTWSSSAPAIGTINATTGLLGGVAAGTTNISYTLSTTGCSAWAQATINALPSAITGSLLVCQTYTTTLNATPPGGTWSEASPNISVVSTTGVVTGTAVGTGNITYSLGTGCIRTAVVTVNAIPAAITPTAATTLCVGNTIALSNATGGGTWLSSNTGIATVGATGSPTTVVAVGPGTVTISYVLTSTGCFSTKGITVNTTPAAITPATASVCTGNNITLSNTVTGGTWSSSNPGRATVDATSGIVTALPSATAGTVNITYAIGTCTVSRTVTVNLSPGAITGGASSVCVGGNTTWTNATGGGTWSSSNTSVATVSSGGVVSGVAPGTALISYTITATGCFVTRFVTVNTTPGAISPTSGNVCVGSTITMTNGTPGGSWSSGDITIATVGSLTGDVNGVGPGTALISYSIGSCFVTAPVVVNATPAAITPATPVSVCVGDVTTLASATTGGAWSSSNTAVATVGTGGVVTGVSLGTALISYTVGLCSVSKVVSVGITPSAITPVAPTVCAGSSIFMSNTVSGGAWTSGNVAVATIASSGMATGIAPGTAVISYAIGSCFATTVLTVTAAPVLSTISGPSIICVSTTGTYSHPTPGGVWSTTTGNASIVAGVATGVAAGPDTIRYSVTNSCGTTVVTMAITVNPLSDAGVISGPSSVCVSGLITLTSSVPGGIWSSSNSNATVGSLSGVVTGVFPGLDTVSYTVSGACGIASSTRVVTINALPTGGTITGPSSVCVGSSIILTSSVPGGTWSVANVTATINTTTGLVTGMFAGTNVVTYTVTDACGTATTTRALTVNPLPDAGTLSGPDSVCMASAITLSPSVPGGVWTAGNTNATVSSSGVVTGVSAGTVPVSYTVTNMCGSASAVKVITVVAPPVAGVISGPASVCLGAGITLSSSAPGGVWSSSNANAVISGPGIVTGAIVGTATISYTVTNLCGTAFATKAITVNPIPVVAAITGPTSHCTGTSITLSNATAGGNWTSSNMAVATVGLSTGIVNGLTAGIVNITYTVTNGLGCPASAIAPDTVYAVPVVAPITGSASVCLGSSTVLASATTGGVWSSSVPGVASVDGTGNVTGNAAGTATISYTVTNICGVISVTRVQTVLPLPTVAAITGTASECAGATTTLSSATAGGVWTSSDASVATVDASGTVTGIAAGTNVITYTVTDGAGCSNFATRVNTVNALPAVAPITGPTSVCVGSTVALSSATSGGVWSTTDASIASVDATGNVTGVAGGSADISYTVTDGFGCSGAAMVTETVLTAPVSGPITGIMTICEGATTTLTGAGTGGTWSSGAIAVATVDASGVVTGLGAGTAEISYVNSNICGTVTDVATVTVNGTPSAGTLSAAISTVCAGGNTTMASTVPGGVWSSGDLSVATVSATGVVTAVAVGTVQISYAITAGGCTGYSTYTLNIGPAIPGLAILPAGSSSLCNGNPVNMHVSSLTPGLTYQWYKNGTMIAGATNSGYIADSVGTYAVTVSNGVCSQMLSGPVVVYMAAPTIGFNPPNLLFTGSYATYQWYRNGVAISGASSSITPIIGPGSYRVVVTDANGCKDTSAVYYVSGGGGGSTGLPVVEASDIRIFPNPAVSTVNIESPVKVRIEVLAADGRKVAEQADATSVDVSKLATGLYMIMVYDENGSLLKAAKFVKAD